MKKTMTKVVSGALALCAVLAMTACNNDPKPNPSKKTHDPVTLQVTGTEKYEAHNFVNGKCTMCETTTIFTQDPIGGTDVITKACDQQGTIEKLEYQYVSADGTEYLKTAWVYLPYGYNAEDKNTKYDVLYMLHGKGLNEGYWLAQGSYKPDNSAYTKGYGTNNVLDNLMKEGKAKKTICVTPTYYLVSDGSEKEDGQFDKELTEVLMPLVAEKYNTYAKDSSAESLIANRDHQGYVGLSLGGMYSYSYIWKNCVPYFSYIGSFSGTSFGEASWNEIIEKKNTEFKDYDIKYWYSGVGKTETDKVYPGDPFGGYLALSNGIDGLKRNENCQFVYCNKTGHNYATWITCLYNCMQVFFQK